MKRWRVYALLLGLSGTAFLIGCKPAAVGVSGMAGLSCANCHSGNPSSPYALAFLQNEAAYQQSGHYNGTRALNPAPANSYYFKGSHALSNSQIGGGICNKCHTDQGFVTAIASGGNFYAVGAIAVTSALPPGCFTCHNPHVTGNFTPRIVSPVTLLSGGTYNFGLGNLCANCHQARATAVLTLVGTPKSGSGPHHGVQSDFLLGENNWVMPAQSYAGTSPHAMATADSCVSCHKYDPYPRSSTSDLQLGGHGFYLTGVGGGPLAPPVGGSSAKKDVVALCTSCHTSASTTFEGIHPTVPDWAGINGGAPADPLVEIRALRDKLVIYFINTAPKPMSKVATSPWDGSLPVWPTSAIEWTRDFVAGASVTLSLVQAQSYWNLQLYLEDRSKGIHNPVFAAQILYDAIVNLNTNAGAGIVIGATRPS